MSSHNETEIEELRTHACQRGRDAGTYLLERYRERLLRMVSVWLEQEPPPAIAPDDLVRRTMDAALERVVSEPMVGAQTLTVWLRGLAWEQFSQLRQVCGQDSGTPPAAVQVKFLSEPAAERLSRELMSADPDTIGRLLKKELRRRLASVLARLGRLDRELLILRHLEGLNMAECAAVMGISEEDVKAHYVEVLGRLKTLLNGMRDV